MPKGPGAYALANTAVVPLHSPETGADYQLFVSYPPDMATSGKTYPTVYMLDANYSFSIVRSVVKHFVDRQNLPPLVLVALAYPGAEEDQHVYRLSRTRDYTPTFVPTGGYGAEFQKVSGGAPKFADFLVREVFPAIESRFHGEKNDRTIIGHSYGGLFASYVLTTRPKLFQRYILVSPSLWYDDGVAFKYEATQAKSHLPLNAHVFLSVGALEDPEMSTDLTRLHDILAVRNDATLHLDMQIYENETHNSVFPGAVTRGLLDVFEAFPAREPSSLGAKP